MVTWRSPIKKTLIYQHPALYGAYFSPQQGAHGSSDLWRDPLWQWGMSVGFESMGWFKGKSIGNQSFYHEIYRFPADFACKQFWERNVNRNFADVIWPPGLLMQSVFVCGNHPLPQRRNIAKRTLWYSAGPIHLGGSHGGHLTSKILATYPDFQIVNACQTVVFVFFDQVTECQIMFLMFKL